MRGYLNDANGRKDPSGWVENNLFTEWYVYIIEKTCPTEQMPFLLILDGHCSNVRNSDVIDLPSENHVIKIPLPPHSIRKLQAIDRTFVGPLKTHYSD